MGYYENGLERIAAVCVGSASVAFGMLPQGTIETSIGLGSVPRRGVTCSPAGS